MSAPLRRDAKVVIGAFLASGTVHLVRPEVYEPLMPSWVPSHREVILASGVAELVCAAGLLFRPTRRLAGLASAALLVGVFPGNVKMAVDASRIIIPGLFKREWNLPAGSLDESDDQKRG